jgi:SAM-dependent methyltransferase
VLEAGSHRINVGHYSTAAEFYDLLYRDQKDYVAEAALLGDVIRAHCPAAATILDVACGTGSHARALIDIGFQVDGVDLEPSFIEQARAKCPEGDFRLGDMTQLELSKRYDAIVCLFSAIGYARSGPELKSTLAGMRSHLNPGGVVVVDPWFEPGQLTQGWITILTGREEDVTVCRMSRTLIEGRTSILEFEYLIGRSTGIERRCEVHHLTLFTQAEMEAAFTAAGLTVEHKPEVLRTRGLYVGHIA